MTEEMEHDKSRVTSNVREDGYKSKIIKNYKESSEMWTTERCKKYTGFVGPLIEYNVINSVLYLQYSCQRQMSNFSLVMNKY